MVHDTLSIIVAISMTKLFAKLFKGEKMLSLLLGIGTGVCGAAVSPITPVQFGIWSGINLHKIAHVAAAAALQTPMLWRSVCCLN